MSGFPKWKYHATKEAVIVKDECAEKALGKEWGDSPTEFHEAAPAPIKAQSPKKVTPKEGNKA